MLNCPPQTPKQELLNLPLARRTPAGRERVETLFLHVVAATVIASPMLLGNTHRKGSWQKACKKTRSTNAHGAPLPQHKKNSQPWLKKRKNKKKKKGEREEKERREKG